MKVILLVIVTIATVSQINAHYHWKPNEGCLNGQIDGWKCCLASDATIYLKHPKYCNLYFKCEHKHLQLKRCSSNHHWSVEHQKCMEPKDAHCENTAVSTTTLKSSTTTKFSQWQLPEGCYDGSVTVDECCKMSQRWYELIPDQKDCHKFYKCYKGKSYHLSCPPHFKWSDEKRKCVYSFHYGCDTKPITTTDSSVVTTAESTITVAPGPLPNGCYDGLIPSSECCKMNIAKSTKNVSIESLIGENFDLDDMRHHHYSSEEKIFNSELLADPKNCRKYYKCVLGKPLHLSCPYHTKWNIQSRKCVYAINTKCTDTEPTTTSTTSTTTEIPTTRTAETTPSTTPAPWRLPDGCYDGSIKAKECCNTEIGKLNGDIQSLEANFRYHHSNEENFNWNNEKLADSKDCHKYFQCKSGKPEHLSCPNHYKWSIELGKCVYSDSKKCSDPEPTTLTTTGKTTEATTLSPTITTSKSWRLPNGCYHGSIKAKECCKIEIEETDFISMSLIGESFDLENYSKHHSGSSSSETTINYNNETLADPKDCHKYYQCKSGKPIHLSCPNHYKWNIELGKCIYSYSKKCTDPDSTTTEPTITITETSTITTTSVSITTAAPWRLPQGCYDGSIKTPKCCKVKINETMDVSSSSSSIGSSKERQVISLETMIAENFDLTDSTEYSGSKSSDEDNNFNTESLADPKNCHKYFICENGKPIHKSCPKHTKWNVELGQCVYAIYEKCSDLEPTPTPPLTTDVISTTKQTEETTTIEESTTESSQTATTTSDDYTTTKETTVTTPYETTSTEIVSSTLGETTITDVTTTTEGSTSTETMTSTEKETTTTEIITTAATTTSEAISSTDTSEKTSTEAATTSDNSKTTEAATTTEIPTNPGETTITEVITTTEIVTSTSEETTTIAPTTIEDFTTTVSTTEKPTKETTITEAATTTEGSTTSGETTTSEETTTTANTTEMSTTSQETTTTEETTTSEETTTTANTTEDSKTSEETTTVEATITTEAITSTKSTTSISEETTTTEITTITEMPTVSEESTTTEATSTNEVITTTETPTSTSQESTTIALTTIEDSTTTVSTTEKSTTLEEITTTEAVSPSQTLTTTETSTSISKETTITEAATTTERPKTSEETTTSEETSTTEASTTTEKPTSSEITTTELITTTEIATSNEAITTTDETENTSESITTNTQDASTTKAVTITTEAVETTSSTTIESTTFTTEDASEATISTKPPTTEEPVTTTEKVTTTSTEEIPTTETTISSTTEDSVIITTPEVNTDPTPDPNGSCGTASYKCRHGIISAKECCKEVPYWEDRLLQNNDNCGTYFQCVHEVPQVRICPSGLYWNADVCRCEWKQLSTCNF